MSGLGNFLAALYRVLSWRLLVAGALMLILTLTQGVGLLMLIPLLDLVGIEVSGGSVDLLTDTLSRIFATLRLPPTLAAVLLIYVVIIGLNAYLIQHQAILLHRLEETFVRTLRQQLYGAITEATWPFYIRHKSSDFTHALTSEMQRIRSAARSSLDLAVKLTVALIYVGLALYLSPLVTLLASVCGLGLVALIYPQMRLARRKGEAITEANRSLYAAIDEYLAGMKVAKSHGIEAQHRRTFGMLSEQIEGAYLDATRNRATANFWFELGAVATLSLVLFVALELLALPVAGVIVLLFLFSRLMPMFGRIQGLYHSASTALPAFDEVMVLLERCRAEAEPPADGSDVLELRRALALRGVRCAYPGGPEVLKDLDLVVEAGKTTAIVGPSGAGKSTISDLIVGLLTPQHGAVLVDDRTLSKARIHPWRRRLGYVAQEPFLFHDTVRANLLATHPEASESDLLGALRAAAADGFVTTLPEGLDTVLGDRGVRLSGGERQRLALARSLLREPELLILDEATSALDAENEQSIQRAIDRLHGTTTMVIIAHRLATVRRADTIYFIEGGRVIEQGSWNQLIRRPGGRFRAMCEAQGLPTAADDTGHPLDDVPQP